MKKFNKVLKIIIALIIITGCSSDDEITEVIEEKIFEGNVSFITQEDVNAFVDEKYTDINGYLCIGFTCNTVTREETNKQVKMAPITDISALSTLKSVSGGLGIQNTDLTTLNGLQNVKGTIEACLIRNNNLLENIEGLNNISEIESVLYMDENDVLKNFGGFTSLISVGELDIEDHPQLENIDGLINLATVRIVDINDNESLKNIKGLSGLTEINELNIDFNYDLLTLEGLHNLVSVSEYFSVNGNEDLIDFCALQKLVDANGFPIDTTINGNAYDPTTQDLENGDCNPQ